MTDKLIQYFGERPARLFWAAAILFVAAFLFRLWWDFC